MASSIGGGRDGSPRCRSGLLDLRFVWGPPKKGEKRSFLKQQKQTYLKLQKVGGGSQMYIEFLNNVHSYRM